MYCDDGDAGRKNRAKISNAAFKCMAVDFADHAKYDKIGYVAFCNDYETTGGAKASE
jgi:hypothetical protein